MGKYDSLCSRVVSDIFFYIKQSVKSKRIKKYQLDYSDDRTNMYFSVELLLKRNLDIDSYFIDIGINPLNENSILLEIHLNPEKEYLNYNSLFYDLHCDIIHEIEHLTQQGINRKKGKPRRTKIEDTTYLEFISKDEIPAYQKGFYHKAKKMRIDINVLINDYLDSFIENKEINKNQKMKIIKKWSNYKINKYNTYVVGFFLTSLFISTSYMKSLLHFFY
jgi:hypothetical protein